MLAAIAFNLTRAAGCLASLFHAHASTATIRRQLLTVPARLARSAHQLRLHLPEHWPWRDAWTELFRATLGHPRRTDPLTPEGPTRGRPVEEPGGPAIPGVSFPTTRTNP